MKITSFAFYSFLLNLDRGEAVQYMSTIRLIGGPRPLL